MLVLANLMLQPICGSLVIIVRYIYVCGLLVIIVRAVSLSELLLRLSLELLELIGEPLAIIVRYI